MYFFKSFLFHKNNLIEKNIQIYNFNNSKLENIPAENGWYYNSVSQTTAHIPLVVLGLPLVVQ